VRLVVDWARKKRLLPRVEILGYCDASASVNWIAGTGGKVMNLLTKGSERHCRVQLGLTPEEHRNAVTQTFRAAKRKRLVVNAYLEDWSNGVRDSFDYVFAMVELLRDLGARRIYLADTLGIMSPEDVTRYVDLMVSTWPGLVFEFHAHNDYGLAAANVLASVRAGARGVHTSVNGLGEQQSSQLELLRGKIGDVGSLLAIAEGGIHYCDAIFVSALQAVLRFGSKESRAKSRAVNLHSFADQSPNSLTSPRDRAPPIPADSGRGSRPATRPVSRRASEALALTGAPAARARRRERRWARRG
jgi:hypothetical protein